MTILHNGNKTLKGPAIFKAEWNTAIWMACFPHNLSADGMTATLKNGQVWKWSNHFNLWARLG